MESFKLKYTTKNCLCKTVDHSWIVRNWSQGIYNTVTQLSDTLMEKLHIK